MDDNASLESCEGASISLILLFKQPPVHSTKHIC